MKRLLFPQGASGGKEDRVLSFNPSTLRRPSSHWCPQAIVFMHHRGKLIVSPNLLSLLLLGCWILTIVILNEPCLISVVSAFYILAVFSSPKLSLLVALTQNEFVCFMSYACYEVSCQRIALIEIKKALMLASSQLCVATVGHLHYFMLKHTVPDTILFCSMFVVLQTDFKHRGS